MSRIIEAEVDSTQKEQQLKNRCIDQRLFCQNMIDLIRNILFFYFFFFSYCQNVFRSSHTVWSLYWQMSSPHFVRYNQQPMPIVENIRNKRWWVNNENEKWLFFYFIRKVHDFDSWIRCSHYPRHFDNQSPTRTSHKICTICIIHKWVLFAISCFIFHFGFCHLFHRLTNELFFASFFFFFCGISSNVWTCVNGTANGKRIANRKKQSNSEWLISISERRTENGLIVWV